MTQRDDKPVTNRGGREAEGRAETAAIESGREAKPDVAEKPASETGIAERSEQKNQPSL